LRLAGRLPPQALAAARVLGSFLLAEPIRVKRPRGARFADEAGG